MNISIKVLDYQILLSKDISIYSIIIKSPTLGDFYFKKIMSFLEKIEIIDKLIGGVLDDINKILLSLS
jgi:hypothetical protein